MRPFFGYNQGAGGGSAELPETLSPELIHSSTIDGGSKAARLRLSSTTEVFRLQSIHYLSAPSPPTRYHG